MTDIPSKGWEYESMLDSYYEEDSPLVTCEYCGTRIRYVHLITHPQYEGFLHVGCDCADRLCATSEASEADNKARSLTRRLDNLVYSPRWNSWNNGHFIDFDGHDIRIWENDNHTFTLQIEWGWYRDKTRFLTSKFPYPSKRSATVAAFRAITDGRLDKYIKANIDKLKKRIDWYEDRT